MPGSQWKDYEIGFTHFIQITYKPDLDTFEKVWMRYGAINLKYNHQGGDILLVIKHKNKNEFGCIVIQVVSLIFIYFANIIYINLLIDDVHYCYWLGEELGSCESKCI